MQRTHATLKVKKKTPQPEKMCRAEDIEAGFIVLPRRPPENILDAESMLQPYAHSFWK